MAYRIHTAGVIVSRSANYFSICGKIKVLVPLPSLTATITHSHRPIVPVLIGTFKQQSNAMDSYLNVK